MAQNNNFDLIGFIFSLILSEDYHATVKSLAAECNLPIPQMRQYLSTLFSNKILLSHFSPTADVEIEDSDPLKTAHHLLDDIMRGNADDQELHLLNMEDYTQGFHLLPITSIESGYIKNIYPDLLKNQHAGMFETKDTADFIPKQILKLQDKVQNAITQELKIEFNYKFPSSGLSKIVCSPVAVIQDLTTHILYVKDTENNYYRIDRIKSDIKMLQEHFDIESYTPSSYQKYFWGTEYKKHDEPVHVKLKIKAETSNIIEKIKRDTILRNETCKLYQEGDYYYYEDDILGLQDFRRWIRGYGSSIIVLEPQILIDEIVDGASRALFYYEKLNSLKI